MQLRTKWLKQTSNNCRITIHLNKANQVHRTRSETDTLFLCRIGIHSGTGDHPAMALCWPHPSPPFERHQPSIAPPMTPHIDKRPWGCQAEVVCQSGGGVRLVVCRGVSSAAVMVGGEGPAAEPQGTAAAASFPSCTKRKK